MFITRKYKHKYISIKDIYHSIKDDLRFGKKGGVILFKEYYAVIKKFWEIVIRDLTERLDLIHLPMNMGYIFIGRNLHKRAFHYRTDFEESNKQQKLIKKRFPILDDYYYTINWGSKYKFFTCKILPLSRFKKAIKKMNNNEY